MLIVDISPHSRNIGPVSTLGFVSPHPGVVSHTRHLAAGDQGVSVTINNGGERLVTPQLDQVAASVLESSLIWCHHLLISHHSSQSIWNMIGQWQAVIGLDCSIHVILPSVPGENQPRSFIFFCIFWVPSLFLIILLSGSIPPRNQNASFLAFWSSLHDSRWSWPGIRCLISSWWMFLIRVWDLCFSRLCSWPDKSEISIVHQPIRIKYYLTNVCPNYLWRQHHRSLPDINQLNLINLF